ncbi:MAG TPA: aspartate kinase [Terriglobia bacterium]|nr:aspartate kinase [Terriglobia bacterium]
MVVIKFGGTSVGAAEQIDRAARIVHSMRERKPMVVVSAMAGVTDALLQAGEAAVSGQAAVRDERLTGIRERYREAIRRLFDDPETARAVEEGQMRTWGEIQEIFTGVSLLREMSVRSRDLISSAGERLMAPLFAQYLTAIGLPAESVDAREIIVTSESVDLSPVDFLETRRRSKKLVAMVKSGVTPVVTGFICSTPDGVTTTLGRGGSDYTASIIGSCVSAAEIQIWTDVSGVMTADPRIVPDARVLDRVSYKEAGEMSYFGAKVLHPQTIMPAVDENIPILIKNTFAPGDPGTLISSETPAHRYGVKTVTSINGMTLVSVEGRGMIGVPGVAGRVFVTTARHRISVLMFSQGSSEQHISLVISKREGEQTVKALQREFEVEIERRRIDRVTAISSIAIIALVGDGIKGAPGVAARAFGTLGAAAINILMIAQGSSELNLSFVVDEKDAPRAVRLLHEAFELAAG